MSYGRVLHVEGPYEGREIEDIVEVDPSYLLEVASTVHGHGISQAALSRAQKILDSMMEDDPYDDYDYAQDQALAFGKRGDFSSDDWT